MVGLFGGVVSELLAIYQHRKIKFADWPRHLKTVNYWGQGLIWVILGGVFAAGYNNEPTVALNNLLAFNIGATAPLIAEQLVRATPKPPPGSVS
jgi:hypothetical protein